MMKIQMLLNDTSDDESLSPCLLQGCTPEFRSPIGFKEDWTDDRQSCGDSEATTVGDDETGITNNEAQAQKFMISSELNLDVLSQVSLMGNASSMIEIMDHQEEERNTNSADSDISESWFDFTKVDTLSSMIPIPSNINGGHDGLKQKPIKNQNLINISMKLNGDTIFVRQVPVHFIPTVDDKNHQYESCSEISFCFSDSEEIWKWESCSDFDDFSDFSQEQEPVEGDGHPMDDASHDNHDSLHAKPTRGKVFRMFGRQCDTDNEPRAIAHV